MKLPPPRGLLRKEKVIDTDLGISASGKIDREGFAKLSRKGELYKKLPIVYVYNIISKTTEVLGKIYLLHFVVQNYIDISSTMFMTHFVRIKIS